MLKVRDLKVTFPNGSGGAPLEAVTGLSFDVAKGETFAIIGESGSGKTITAQSLLSLQPAVAKVSGSVRLAGRELVGLPEQDLRKIRGKQVGFVYQNPLSALNPVWTVGEQIAETMRAHGVADRKRAAMRTLEFLDLVNIPDPARVAKAYPHQISGGMLQRAVIAMALACNPELLIADEPTTALDVTIKAQILDLLGELRKELGLTIILITHDMDIVAELANRIMVVYSGAICEIGATDQVMLDPQHPYSRALIMTASISATRHKSPLPAISGAAPSLSERPSGCFFQHRCDRSEPVCAGRAPVRVEKHGSLAFCHNPLMSKEAVRS